MDMAAALTIVLDLAKQSALSDKDYNADEMIDVIKDQQEAINMVEDLIVNEYGDD